MKYRIAVKGIIERDGKLLALRRAEHDTNGGMWETVGGSMEMERNPKDELKREVREETGLDVEVSDPFNVFTMRRTSTGEFVIGITFICTSATDEDVTLSDEHSECRWVTPDEFLVLSSTPGVHNEIRSFKEKYGK